MSYIKNDLARVAFSLKEIERYLLEKNPRVGDALYTCEAVLLSLDGTEEGKTALAIAQERFMRGG